jgi:hypothetical protein
MIGEQFDEALADQAGGAENAGAPLSGRVCGQRIYRAGWRVLRCV